MRAADRRLTASIGEPGAARKPSDRARRPVDRGVRERFRDGNPDAVRAVYQASGRLVYAVAFRVLGDRDLSEHATQPTFLQAWRAATSVDLGREFGPWLATIGRRVAIDIYRREVGTAGPLDFVAPNDSALLAPGAANALLDAWQLRQAVSELIGEQRENVRVQHSDGLGYDQIAERLRVPVGTVKSRSFRAHRRLVCALGICGRRTRRLP